LERSWGEEERRRLRKPKEVEKTQALGENLKGVGANPCF
jgi:hypothetical protein